MDKTCALVFGGSGFIGTRLVKALRGAGFEQIISFDLRGPREIIPGVDYVIGDVRSLESYNPPYSITKIFNLAAIHTTPGHPYNEYYETNILGALQVTKLAIRLNVPEVIFTSSISVYGPDEAEKSEDSRLNPASAYGHSKAIAEKIHIDWQCSGEDRRLIIVRPAVVFGPGEGGNFTRLSSLLRRGFFVYPGRKDTIKACIYVDDLIDCIFLASNAVEKLIIFNGAYAQKYTIEDIVKAFSASYFPNVVTVKIPTFFVYVAARILMVVGSGFEGVHHERVTKLTRSTNINPGWLTSRGFIKDNNLDNALERWHLESGGSFS